MVTTLFIALSLCGVDAPTTFQVAIDEVIELPCKDCDGVALGDINKNGKMDILASSGDYGEVFWFEQGADYTAWRKRLIYAMPAFSGEFEGNDLADFDNDGRLEAVSLDQPNGNILLHKQRELENDVWETVVLQPDRPYVQATLITDYTGDGRPEMLYTWEGDAPGRGGVHLLQFTGDDVMNPDNWTDRALMPHESAWWLARERRDWTGNGSATDMIYTARNILRRNEGARPGLFLLEVDSHGDFSPTRHVIDENLPHPLHVDFGDISGAGHGNDLVVGGFDTRIMYWYAWADNWERHELALPEVSGAAPNRIWNVKTIPLPGNRDALLAPVTNTNKGALLCYEYVDGDYRPNVLLQLDYRHPIDDRIVLHDLSGNGVPEAIMPDSGVNADGEGLNRLLIVSFTISEPEN